VPEPVHEPDRPPREDHWYFRRFGRGGEE
jgi:hypothetical protein